VLKERNVEGGGIVKGVERRRRGKRRRKNVEGRGCTVEGGGYIRRRDVEVGPYVEKKEERKRYVEGR
jgi:hypothetical protein